MKSKRKDTETKAKVERSATTAGQAKKRHFKRIPDTPENIAKAVLKSRKKQK